MATSSIKAEDSSPIFFWREYGNQYGYLSQVSLFPYWIAVLLFESLLEPGIFPGAVLPICRCLGSLAPQLWSSLFKYKAVAY
jgi:hypothetical protein